MDKQKELSQTEFDSTADVAKNHAKIFSSRRFRDEEENYIETPENLKSTGDATVSFRMNQEGILSSLLDQIEPVNFRDYLNIPDNVKVTSKHFVVGIIKNLREVATANQWNLAKVFDYVYVYNGKNWDQIDKDSFKSFLGNVAIKMGYVEFEAIHYDFKESLMKQFLTDGYLPLPPEENKEILINLQNGTFEFKNNCGILKDFDPKNFLTYTLPFEYDPKAECFLFKKYLDKVIPDIESQQVLQEFMGYVFTNINLEKLLILTGGGQNGKSVFFNIVCALLGSQNILNYSMGLFAHEYNRSKLINVLLNYSSEKGTDLNVDIFKALVSGEPLQAREPYGKSFTIKNKVRFIINANELPKGTEQTDAYHRRFLIIPFDVKISDKEKDINLADKIIQNELPGVFNWVLEGLERLVKQERFSECKKSIHALIEFRKSTDSIAIFIEDQSYQLSLLNKTSLADIYKKYKDFCADDNYRPLAKRKFGIRLEGLGFERTRMNDGGSAFFIERRIMSK